MPQTSASPPAATLVGVQPNDVAFRNVPDRRHHRRRSQPRWRSTRPLLTVTTGGTYTSAAARTTSFRSPWTATWSSTTSARATPSTSWSPTPSPSPPAHTWSPCAASTAAAAAASTSSTAARTPAANGITGTAPVSNFQTIPLTATSYATTYVSGNGYQNAAILNNAISVAGGGIVDDRHARLRLQRRHPEPDAGRGATLTVANGTGAAGSLGNGALIVTGTTTLGATATLNPTTGTLVLAGGVTDGGNGLTKTGAGNVILGPSAGTFTGAVQYQ